MSATVAARAAKALKAQHKADLKEKRRRQMVDRMNRKNHSESNTNTDAQHEHSLDRSDAFISNDSDIENDANIANIDRNKDRRSTHNNKRTAIKLCNEKRRTKKLQRAFSLSRAQEKRWGPVRKAQRKQLSLLKKRAKQHSAAVTTVKGLKVAADDIKTHLFAADGTLPRTTVAVLNSLLDVIHCKLNGHHGRMMRESSKQERTIERYIRKDIQNVMDSIDSLLKRYEFSIRIITL